MRFGLAFGAFSLVSTLALVAGCVDREFISVEKDPVKRPIGDACVVDDECGSGRCIAGICDDDGCESNQDCRSDEICVFDICQPVDDFACQPNQAPLLSISTLSIDFNQVNIGQVATETITIENIGDCLLTLSSVGLDDQGSPGFGCDPCDPEVFPQRVPPNGTLDIDVTYSPPGPGEADSTLFVRGDDVTAGDEGLIAVTLHADYDGIPSLSISPPELNFGFVPFVAGGAQGELTKTIEITNRGTGNAALVIERMFVNNGVDFELADATFEDIDPDNTLIVPPYDPNDLTTVVTVPITFRPTRNADLEDELVVRAEGFENVPVVLRGSSLGPPQISVSTDELTFKCGVGTAGGSDVCPTNEAYPVGVVTFRTVTITNQGQSELTINMTIGGEGGDFAVSPTFIPPIPAGGSVPISVFFNPSAPSDLANPFNPLEPFNAVLNITSNDTDPATDVLKTVVLEGFSKGGQNDQVLKLEMIYENADNSWAGNDFRDVDLVLNSPTGFTCGKPVHQFIPDGNGGFIIGNTEDPCDDWNAFGQEGQANWLALGQFEEPERVILFGLGPTGAEGDTFTPTILYIEDCANIPTGLLADLLGIGGSILLGILGGAVGVPVAVPPDQISDFVANNCFDHDGSTVTVHISLDGVVVASPQHRLENKNDFFDIAHLLRTDGQFCDPSIGIACP